MNRRPLSATRYVTAVLGQLGDLAEVRGICLKPNERKVLEQIDRYLQAVGQGGRRPDRVLVNTGWYSRVLARHEGATGLSRNGIPLEPLR